MTVRLIDADELLRKLKKRQKYLKEDGDIGLIYLPVQAIMESEHVSEVVEKMAQRGVEPVKRGLWEDDCGKSKCSECGYSSDWITNYCPGCGAKLEEVSE